SALRRPRFTLTSRNRKIDAPDFATPIVPSLDAYKLARRELATTLMSAGVTPGTYELASAKSILDQARDSFRSIIHERISKLTQAATLTFCVEQIAALMIENANAAVRAQLSLTHEVSYDRAQAAAEIHDKFAQDSRNYRYMLEACLSMSVSSCEETPTARILNDLLAAIDWLFILYNASDVLHNGIDVGGITIDADYIPEVFYSQLNDEQETEFAREQADARLGINLSEPDRMLAESERLADLERLDLAFEADVGFTFRHLLQTLEVLSCWQRAQNHEELLLSYRSTSEDIVDVLRQSIPDLTQASASALVSFATLEANQVRRLLGRARDEADVPVWDHNKRSSRYTIRPLVPIENDLLVWSAPSAQLAGRIWLNSVTDGYLPADFEWPAVVPIVRSIKERLEALLENRAAEICRRGTSFVEKGIDFKSRFPSESFDDVGDFDVLAYWPASNTWISAECKYNQPPFCLKDARRLRERIFGRPPDRGHFSKIERRREFLNQNRERLRRLLNWPESGAEFKIFELYVSRDIYWWMRNPPFAVSTDFVRIDALDHWLRVRMLITEERDR
ncbi:hypothetical protein, partial [Methylosinus sp. R-45379]|uniref:hypothetical protein n=1 Tax=Methylosinus sp. R-45379 TaxID=980563 RepID=UPI000A86C666